jgi:hypothetical protein
MRIPSSPRPESPVLVTVLFALAVPALAAAQTPISGASPYPDGGDPTDPVAVTACNLQPQLGRVYRNSEAEPHLAVNPTDPDNLIAAWQQDRWSNGGAQGNLMAYSLDGGSTWSPANAPFSLCAGAAVGSTGDYERASDPWVTFGPDGAAYSMAVVFDTSDAHNGMAVSKSLDGGATWSAPVLIKASPANGGHSNSYVQLYDKNTMTPDPFDPDFVYATWTLFRNGNTAVQFSRSTDGGLTWGPARPINHRDIVAPPEGATFRQDLQIVVLPDGTLVNAFYRNVTDPQGGAFSQRVEMAIFRSHDRGAHWEQLDTVVALVVPTVGFDLELGIYVRGGINFPDLTVDPQSGTLYMVWQDGSISPYGLSNLVITRSTDGGDTWSAPIALTQRAIGGGFLPAAAVAADGTVGVLFYDFRNDVFGDAELTTDVYLQTLDSDLNLLDEVRLTDSSFDMRQMVLAGGYFPGDYVGLEAAGNDFVAAFTVANDLGLPVEFPNDTVLTVDDHDRQDVVFARVDR